ncbi:MAG TPA: TetR/AcrR family transcriptional regulator [Acidimicrobiia bacterium]|nr:TetR/AcrR family transcriptional regulator [Acidimicrobiia bacterium]
MARPKKQEKRRRELMEAAQRAIATRGLGALRLKDVAEEAGMTGPAVSYYYPDLKELLVDVYERQAQLYLTEAPRVLEGSRDPWTRLTDAVLQDLPTGPDDVDSIIMYQFAGEPSFIETYRELSSTLHERQVEIYSSIIEAGMDAGVFSPALPVDLVARTIIALADAYGLQVVVGEPGMTRQLALHEILAAAGDLLRTDRPTTSS